MTTILLPTDFSETAENATNYAISAFGIEQVKYILLNAYQVPHAGASMLVSVTDILRQESEKDLEKEADRLQKRFGPTLNLKSKSLHGDVLSTVESILESQEISYIALGTNGASGLKEVLVGSNAATVIRNSNIPVLLVPSNANFAPWEKVVFATDFHEIESAEVLEPLLSMCTQNNSKVELLNVRKKDEEADAEKSLQELALHYALENIEHNFKYVDHNDVVKGLEEYLQEERPNLVAMVPRHTRFLDRIFHRSVTNRLAMHTDIPLLSLPERTR